jgi:hypothetical protein
MQLLSVAWAGSFDKHSNMQSHCGRNECGFHVQQSVHAKVAAQGNAHSFLSILCICCPAGFAESDAASSCTYHFLMVHAAVTLLA